MPSGRAPVVAKVVRKLKAIEEADALAAAYEPTRAAKLRTSSEPPPLPAAAGESQDDGFGAADEDGLRMLAALETLTSLEPDYAVDLAIEEASVTIIESFDHEAVAHVLVTGEPLERYGRPPADDGAPALLLNGYETFTGFGEEASIEIVEVSPAFDAEAAARPQPPEQPASLAERLAKTGRVPRGRFFKALSGD